MKITNCATCPHVIKWMDDTYSCDVVGGPGITTTIDVDAKAQIPEWCPFTVNKQ